MAKSVLIKNANVVLTDKVADCCDVLVIDGKIHRIDKNIQVQGVDVVDGNGLRYRSFAECIAVTADGEPDDLRAEEMRMYAFAEAILIFDEAGNVIFEIDPELFK